MTDIYALIDPISNEVRYIGKANDAQKRFKSHLSETRRNTPVYCWIKSLRERALVPKLQIIAVCAEADWKEMERKAIASARESNARLLNVAEGGDEPFCPHEVRVANGKKAALSRVRSPENARIYRLKRDIGNLLKRGYVSEATKEKLRYAARKRPDLFGIYAAL